MPMGVAAFDAGFIASDAPFNLEALLYFTGTILPLIRRQRPEFRLLVTGGVTVPYALLGPLAEGVVLETILLSILNRLRFQRTHPFNG